MIALLALQIAVVAGWGLETKGRALEDVAAGGAPSAALAPGAGELPSL
jgi:hypothetical protein